MRSIGKLWVTSAILALTATTALAGECARFGGVYLGVNAGMAAHDTTLDFQFASGSFGTNAPERGGTAGAQIGYNWQQNCTLLGVELDANWSGLGSSKRYGPAMGPNYSIADDVEWFGTARLRGGVVVQNLLLYLTAGVAFADISHQYSVVEVGLNKTFRADDMRLGAVAGAGLEWAWSERTSFKLEGLYHYFGETTTTAFGPGSGRVEQFSNTDSIWTVRAGVNFKLGGG
jgi:outer membrane immunogenic protein